MGHNWDHQQNLTKIGRNVPYAALTQDTFNNIVYPFESKYSIFIELFNKNIVQFSRKLDHGYLKGGSTELTV